MARDVITTWCEVETDSFDVRVNPRFGSELTERLATLRAEREQAERAQASATGQARELARSLHDEGFTVRNIGQMLGISYQRAQQLILPSRRTACERLGSESR